MQWPVWHWKLLASQVWWPTVQLASSDQSLQSLSPSQRHASRMQTPRVHVNSPGPHWWDSERQDNCQQPGTQRCCRRGKPSGAASRRAPLWGHWPQANNPRKPGYPSFTAVLLITVVPAVVLMVTPEGQGDAGARGHAAELVAGVTGRRSWGTQTPAVKPGGQKAALKPGEEGLRHSCSSLMSPQSLSLSHFQMLLMQRPLEQRYWLGRQLCSDWRRRTAVNHTGAARLGPRRNPAAVSPVLTQVLFCSW